MTTNQTSRPAALVVLGLVATLFAFAIYHPWDLRRHFMVGAPFGRDFVNFWIGGKLAREHATALFQDVPAYNALISDVFHHARDKFIFSYPPHILLALAPLSLLPYLPALLLWTGANLGAVAAATWRLAPEGGRRRLAVLACLSPVALTTVMFGHFGGLMALAFVVIALDSEERPVLAGLCLAALTVKPQIAAVLGVVLLCAGRWRCLPYAAAATAALAGLSVAVFGVEPWIGFVTFTLPEQQRIFDAGRLELVGTSVSVMFAAQVLHLGRLAMAAQVVASLVAVGVAVRSMRRRDDPTTLAFVVPLATLLALPYVNGYDLAAVAPALTVLVFGPPGASRLSPVGALTWIVAPLAWCINSIGVPAVPLVLMAALLLQARRTPLAEPPSPEAPSPARPPWRSAAAA